MIPLVPLSPLRKGVPWLFFITPQTSDEASSGKPVLIAQGDLPDIIDGLRRIKARAALIEKFEKLLN